MASPQNYFPNQQQQQQLRMMQGNINPPSPFSYDGRDPSHTSYRQSPPQHQMQSMQMPQMMVNSMQPKGILRTSPNYNQNSEQRLLMAQLRQKEAELAKYKVTYNEFQKLEQTNRGLKSRLDAQMISNSEKDKKIAMLVGKLNLEKRSNGSAVADAIAETKIKRLNEQLEETKQDLKARDEEVVQLTAQNKLYMLRAIEYEKKASFQANSQLEDELTNLKAKFDQVNGQNSTCKNTIEELVKRVKVKECMINSLNTEKEEWRNRESRLNAHVNTLKKTIESYDSMLSGKDADVDVPMLLAKLVDYETQVMQLQNQQQQQQTGSSDDDQQLKLRAKAVDFKMDLDDGGDSLSKQKKSDDGTIISNEDFSMGNTIEEDDDEDDGTFVTMKTMDDTFAPTAASSKYKCIDDFNPKHHADEIAESFNDLIEDVKEGFHSFRSDGVFGGVSDLYEYLTDEQMDKKDPTKNASIVDILLGLGP